MSRATRVSRMFLVFVTLTFLALITGQSALGVSNFGQPVPGQHIYDQAGVLTIDQKSMLEQHARQVEAAGAPVVVYLQAKSANYSQTEQDARDLMDQWNVQSAPDAHDGLVFFFNLKPNDLHHGEAALFAGAKHYDGGNLPEHELQRIFSKVMKPDLANGDLAQGIAAGLDAAANSLRNGPPPPPEPSAAERLAADISRGPISFVTIFSIVVTAIFARFTLGVWRTRPRSQAPIAATTSPPDSTSPSVVGAVVTGRVKDQQLEAAILDLANRGALVIESGTKKNEAQVRLLDSSVPNNEIEREVWHSLETRSDSDGVVSKTNLAMARSSWSDARESLRTHLIDNGLYDPNAKARRRPVYLASFVIFLVAAAEFAIGIIGKQLWAYGGAALLGIAVVVGLVAMSSYPDTSGAGAELAAIWGSYIAGIKRSKSDRTLDVNLELDEAMPYAVAAGVTSALSKRLKKATEDGYMPVWLGPSDYRNGTSGNAYIWWTGFHSAVTPSSSGGSSGGGASSGGGGAGGSF